MRGIECSFLQGNECLNDNVHTDNNLVDYAVCSICRYCDGLQFGHPGNCLKELLRSVEIYPNDSCPCEPLRMLMNQWGPQGCRDHLGEICESIYAEYEKWKIGKRGLVFQQATIAAKLLAMGIIVNPLDPIRSLVLEAIRRAEKQQESTAPP